MNYAIQFCKEHHFADDTKLYFNSSIQKINRLFNLGMKHLNVRLNGKKKYLNLKKIDLCSLNKMLAKFIEHETS